MTRRYAGFASRGAARIIDIALLALIVGGTSWLVQQFLAVNAERCPPIRGWWHLRGQLCPFIPYLAPAAGATIPPVYRVLFWSITGRTPGMAFMGLRLLKADGTKVGAAAALKRVLAFILTVGLGSLLILVTQRRRALHDLVGGTVVVYDWGEGFPLPTA